MKAELAITMITHAVDTGMPTRWVTGTPSKAQRYRLRKTMEDCGVCFELARPMNRRGIV